MNTNSNYVIIESSNKIIVVENRQGLRKALLEQEASEQPLKRFLSDHGFNVLDALPVAVAELN